MEKINKLKQISGPIGQRALAHVKEMRDVRVLGLNVFVVLVVLVSWSGVNVIQTNYDLQKKIARIEQENTVRQLENSNLKLRNQYYDTDQYLELTARRQLGRAMPGETLLLVPKEVALTHSVEPLTQTQKDVEQAKPHKPAYQQNFEAWVEFLFNR